ncbi:DDE-type integrase/transposase/recombinase [Roseobacter sp. YSTF-M11]|uniref:DDE-type integrase/transposase/recombinase n=1 Tax=Roseobacter insulae TaxID=2859783 RepID=A0A9X1FWK5_9RHOB|nr:DDE-type integrase/transposase/recombinase [Roseobacter insulae]
MDNGREYVSGHLQDWAEKAGIRLIYLPPGKPQQNAYVERYNRTARTEWLGRHHCSSMKRYKITLRGGVRHTTTKDQTWGSAG